MKIFLLLFIFVSCIQRPVEEVQLDIKKKDCDKSGDQLVNARSLAASPVKIKCDEIAQYKCNIREFSPDISNGEAKEQQYCTKDDQCLNYDLYSFDTSSMRETDQFAVAKDFEKGGQYNYQEVQCFHISGRSKGLAGDGADIDEALEQAIGNCEKLGELL